jgi:hypothetical protein
MRSQFVFVMHPEDETEFAQYIIAESGVVFVDGPSWPVPRPPTMTDIHNGGNYLMIWNPTETPDLMANHHQKDGKEWWYCNNEFLTIQFLRSGFQYDEPYLFEGRIAIATTDKTKVYYHEPTASSIERRFKTLTKLLKKTYTNKVIIYQNVSLPRSKTNPLRPSTNCWVGPHAMEWLREEPSNRWVQQFREGRARGYLIDLTSDSGDGR